MALLSLGTKRKQYDNFYPFLVSQYPNLFAAEIIDVIQPGLILISQATLIGLPILERELESPILTAADPRIADVFPFPALF
jgi:hypothetical protein